MNYKELKQIQVELERFNKVVKEALKEVEDIREAFPNTPAHNLGITISGTHLSGAVKRKYIDFKYEINKIIKN